MKWCAIFSLPFNEYSVYHIIEWRLLIVFLAFMPIYFFLHIFHHEIPHFIHLMKNRCICVSHSKHLINRSCESQNICNLVPLQIIQNIIPYGLSFSYFIFSIWHPFLTNDHILKIIFYLKQSFKHDDYWSKSCFSNNK